MVIQPQRMLSCCRMKCMGLANAVVCLFPAFLITKDTWFCSILLLMKISLFTNVGIYSCIAAYFQKKYWLICLTSFAKCYCSCVCIYICISICTKSVCLIKTTVLAFVYIYKINGFYKWMAISQVPINEGSCLLLLLKRECFFFFSCLVCIHKWGKKTHFLACKCGKLSIEFSN